MGHIYKIINNINNKTYVGKTKYSDINQRFKEHLRDSKKPTKEKRPLYAAMQKYGTENFTIIDIETCPNEILNEREQYWINTLDSYKNGYNATKGGDGSFIYDRKLILSLLLQSKTTREIQDIINCGPDIIYEVAKENNINLKAIVSKSKGKNINQFTLSGELVQTFTTISEAGDWCLQMGLSKGKIETIRKKISGCINNEDRHTAYGYIWKLNK